MPAGGYNWDSTPANLEGAVLSHILARPDAEAGKIIDRLHDEAFSHKHLREIFHEMRTLRNDRRLLFGLVEVTDRLRTQGTLLDTDPLYLVQLAEAVFAPSLLVSLVAKLRVNACRQLARDLAKALHDAAEAPKPDLGGVAALLRTIADDLEEDRPDQGLHDLTIYTRSRRDARARR